MLRYLSVICVVLFSACKQNAQPIQGGNDLKKRDFITCTDKVVESAVVESKGGTILRDCDRAYAALQSYVGTVTLKSVADYKRGPHRESRTLKVFFRRPANIRLEGSVDNSGKFLILSDGRTTKVFGLGLDDTRETMRDAMLEFAGVSLGTCEMLPGFLLDTKWHRDTLFLPYGAFLPAFATKANLMGEEKVGEHLCYRIVCPREIATWTFYVDEKTLLICRLDEGASEEQMRVQRQLGGGGFSGKIESTQSIQSFDIEQINIKLDEAIFAKP